MKIKMDDKPYAGCYVMRWFPLPEAHRLALAGPKSSFVKLPMQPHQTQHALMDTKTLDALKASIAHWRENLAKAKAGERFETGPGECALCKLYWAKDCVACPVRASTGRAGCIDTPYEDVRRAILWRRSGGTLIKATEDEVEFLQSLLPPGTLP